MDYYYEQPFVGERYLGSGEYQEDILYLTSEPDDYVLDSILRYAEECGDGDDVLMHVMERVADDYGISYAEQPNVTDVETAPYPMHYN